MGSSAAIAFFLLAVAAAWRLADGRGPWPVRAALITIVPVLAFQVWRAFDSLPGWPTTDPLPGKALFVASAVAEPDKLTGDPGVVYLLLVPQAETRRPWDFRRPADGAEPRLYRLPYSRKLHERAQRAGELRAAGAEVAVTANRKGGGQAASPPRFYLLPPPGRPAKPTG